MFRPLLLRRRTALLTPLLGLASALAPARAAPGVVPAGAPASSPAPAPPWLPGGRPGALARQAVALLAAAADDGLDPQDYGADALTRAIDRAAQGPALPPPEADHLERALTSAMESFLWDLHRGRIDPRQIHHDFAVDPAPGFDAAAALAAARAAQDLPAALQAARPALPQYGQLRQALAAYRALAGHPAWQQPLPPLPLPRGARAGKLEPGQPWAGLARLAERLAALGDLAAPLPAPAPLYEGPLVEALRAFQKRHGLAADGVIGRATLAALQVPPATRARQIELMLERLRWTPLMQGPRMIVVNIPEFMLRAYEVRDGRIRVHTEMKVVVGRALDTRTPLFDEDMRFIEFSPYWNVPPSIARDETIPRLRRDPGYFERQGFEFVGAGGQPDTVLTAAKLDAVLAGRLRIRQRPGPQNALGDIKFVFPNRENIYLHHTPATALFERERRDFSHGCIRVEQPVALARFVLQPQPDWTEQRIREAMARGRSSTLRLDSPLPVLIAYGTSLFKYGRVYFYEDIYGHDRKLDDALRERSARLKARPKVPRP